MDPMLLLAAAWLLGSRRQGPAPASSAPASSAPSSSAPASSAPASSAPSSSAPASSAPASSPAPIPRGAEPARQIARADSPRAAAWEPLFRAQDAPAPVAAALARWAGIESGGNPLAVSRIGERGLLQIGRQTAGAALTGAEWDALASPATTREEHARIALKQYRYHVSRARRWVANPPPPSDYESWAWYAKLHHGRPRDLQEARVHGPARLMARDLAVRWARDPRAMARLRAANIVAFGAVTP